MRNMSFALTTEQIMAGTKTVTRRLGWLNLKPGQQKRRTQAVRLKRQLGIVMEGSDAMA